MFIIISEFEQQFLSHIPRFQWDATWYSWLYMAFPHCGRLYIPIKMAYVFPNDPRSLRMTMTFAGREKRSRWSPVSSVRATRSLEKSWAMPSPDCLVGYDGLVVLEIDEVKMNSEDELLLGYFGPAIWSPLFLSCANSSKSYTADC